MRASSRLLTPPHAALRMPTYLPTYYLFERSPEGVIHLMASRIHDRTADLSRLSQTHDANPLLSRADEFLHPQYHRHQHPRDARILPKSRDFH